MISEAGVVRCAQFGDDLAVVAVGALAKYGAQAQLLSCVACRDSIELGAESRVKMGVDMGHATVVAGSPFLGRLRLRAWRFWGSRCGRWLVVRRWTGWGQ